MVLKYNEIIYKACQPAFKRASENAKKHGTPFGMVILTTPNNKDNPAGAWCYKMLESAAPWNITCFDLSDEELDEFVQSSSKNSFLFVQYTYKELGRDDAWLQEMIRQMNGDTATIKREILLDWPRSMDSSVFTEDDLDKIYKYIKQPIGHLFLLNKKFILDLFENIDVNKNYIISCDVSGGLSQDNSVLLLIDPEDFRVVGEFRNNKIDTDNFKKLIVEMMTFYFRNALLVIEKNSYGLPILDSLMKNPQIEPRMYRENRKAAGEKKLSDGFVVKKKTSTVSYGVETNAVSRKKMFDMLPEIVELEYDKFISPNLYSDIAGLEKKKNGKIEHSASGHDDSLMAYLIFRYAVFYGKCFKDKFGINPVPSRMNVRVVSSQENFSRISALIQSANKIDDLSLETLNQNPMYQGLVAHQAKLQENSDENTQMDAFMRIANLNKW